MEIQRWLLGLIMTCLSTPLMLSSPKSALLVNTFATEPLFCLGIAVVPRHYVVCVICILYTFNLFSPLKKHFASICFVFSMKCTIMVVYSKHITM